MCMHWFRGELLRSPMALKILRKGDVIRLKQATSLHSILICLVPHIDCARNPTFQNWGVTVQRKFLREHSCASPDTLIVLLAFVFAHRWIMWRQKNRSCPWSNTLSSSTCSARFRHNPWKLLAKKCAGNNTSTKTFLVFFSRPLTSGISCRYYNLTALVICFFSPPQDDKRLFMLLEYINGGELFSWPLTALKVDWKHNLLFSAPILMLLEASGFEVVPFLCVMMVLWMSSNLVDIYIQTGQNVAF